MSGSDSARAATLLEEGVWAGEAAIRENDSVLRQIRDPSRKLFVVGSSVPVPGFEEELQLRATRVNGQPWQEAVYRGNQLHAAQLERAGFVVLRNPLPLVYHDNHITKVRHWYFASSNNAIVETDGRRRAVWLPTYGHGCWRELEATDRRNEEIWRDMGFEAFLLGDFHPFVSNLGSLRCMTKCLIRS